MSDWISARVASCRVRAVDLTEGDLIEWARQGKLCTRAQSGTFSSDDPGEERKFPAEPPSGEIERLAGGSWPNIPAEFWEATLAKALWGAGTFAASVRYWEEYDHDFASEYIELFNVTFSKDDLEAVLNGPPPPAARAQVPKERWQQQRVSQQQAAVFKFMEIATTRPMKGELGRVARHGRYCEWHADPTSKQTGKPLGRSAFTKWADRYLDGWRADGSRWVYNT